MANNTRKHEFDGVDQVVLIAALQDQAKNCREKAERFRAAGKNHIAAANEETARQSDRIARIIQHALTITAELDNAGTRAAAK